MTTREEILATWETKGQYIDWCAIDSYNPVTGTITRLFVGTSDDCANMVNVYYMQPSETACSNFYRNAYISNTDALRFFHGDNGLPDERGAYSVTETAELLGVSRQRVLQMLNSGKLDGRKVGNVWTVYRYSVEERKMDVR